MSLFTPVQPTGASGPIEEDPFLSLQSILGKASCAEKDYRDAIHRLFGLMHELKSLNQLSVSRLYEYLLKLLPHFSEEEFATFCTSHLSTLLVNSLDSHNEHRKLALVLGAWKLSHPRDESLGSALQAGREAMDYYVEAIAIAEEHQLEIDETHRQATVPFVKIVKCTLGQGRPIKKRLLNATRAWKDHPEQFFKCYEEIEKLVEKLKLFNCNPEGEEVIKEVYQQTLEALNFSSPEFKAQRRFVEGNYFQQLRVKLSQPVLRPARWATQRYRMGLKDFRDRFDIGPLDNINAYQERRAQDFVSLFQGTFFHDLEAIFLNAFPCLYDLRAMGSIAKKEICPFSDLEYLILIDDENHREFFRHVATLLELQIASLGETPLSTRSLNTLRQTLPINVKKGFHVDLGGNPAQHSGALIRTPARMAELQLAATDGPSSFENTTRKTVSLKKSDGAEDESPLYIAYKGCLANILDPLGGISLRLEKALIFMIRRLEAYGEMPSPLAAPSGQIDLKAQFIEPLFHLISDMAFYWNAPGNNTLDLIKGLTLKGSFSADSQALLQEAVSFIYSLRVTLHGLYGQQKDVITYGSELPVPGSVWINEEERRQLDKIYWLVIRPLYTCFKTSLEILPYPTESAAREEMEQSDGIIILRSSESGLEPTFVRKLLPLETVFQNVHLANIAFGEIFGSHAHQQHFFKPVIEYHVHHLVKTVASRQKHLSFFKELSKSEKYEPLREHYLAKVEESAPVQAGPLLQELAVIPNASTGLRHSFLRGAIALRQAVLEMTVPNPQAGTIAVRVRAPFLTGDHYLRKEVIDQILVLEGSNKGHIKRSYGDPRKGGSAHPVSPAQWKGYDLHFKEMPSHPLMNEAVHNFLSRLEDGLTPSGVLVCFEIDGKPYPVWVSETKPGTTLKEWKGDPQSLDLSQLTWMLLGEVLIHPGDGGASNYVVDDQRRIACIDPEAAFVEPVIKDAVLGAKFGKPVVNFYSALFCLFPLNTPLNRDVLNAFANLDIAHILMAWIDDLIKTEEEYRSLFPVESLPRDEKGKLIFTPMVLLRQGTMATLYLQFWSLQKFIKTQTVPITIEALLGQLLSIREDFKTNPIGPILQRKYQHAIGKGQELQQRLSQIRSQQESLSWPQYLTAALEAVPSEAQVRHNASTPFSLEMAKQELSLIVLRHSDHFVVNNKAFVVDFKEVKLKDQPDIQRQTSLLQILAKLMSMQGEKVTSITFRNCAALNAPLLEPFLHGGVEHLEIERCDSFGQPGVEIIQRKNRFIKELKISHCPKLVAVAEGVLRYPLRFPLLEKLHLEYCPALTQLRLRSVCLKNLTVFDNPLLEKAELFLPLNAKISKEGCHPTFDPKRQSLTDSDLKDIQGLPLSSMSLQGCDKITDAGLVYLKGMPLTSLDLRFCSKITDAGLAHLKDLPLKFLILKWCKISDAGLAHFKGMSLQSLNLDQTGLDQDDRITDAGLAYLKGLQSLSLVNCKKITNTGLALLKGMPLQFLNLTRCRQITDQGLAHLHGMPLQNLVLNGCDKITDEGLSHLKGMPLLSLKFDCWRITDAGLAHLKGMPLLTLELNCWSITDAGLAHLKGMPLQFLELSSGQFTGAGLAHLQGMPLQTLSLYKCDNITDASLVHLSGMPIHSLDLRNCRITDAGLAHLRGMPLKSLYLSGCKNITDTGLVHLHGMPLKSLNLEFCDRITDKGIAELQAHIPNIEIIR